MSRYSPLPRFQVAACFAILLLACTGPAGMPAVDTGSIAGTVADPTGALVAGASVSTNPMTSTAETDASGAFTLSSIPIGAYTLTASKSGYTDGSLTGVGVGAGATLHVKLALAPSSTAVGSLSGTISGRKGTPGTSVPVSGAQVCVEGTSNCVATASDGTYTLGGVSPGSVFVSATATGFLAGEIRQAVSLAPAGTAAGVNITLSGQPSSQATYVGSTWCVGCHISRNAAVVSAWQASAHATVVDRTTAHVDVTGWPVAGASCTTPDAVDSTLTALDPNPAINDQREVWLLHYAPTCTPAFAMALDSNQDGKIDTGDTIIPVNGSMGGVAAAAGQCSNGGVIPGNAPCQANLLGAAPSTTMGWWQQEYLVNIGPGAGKPSWVSWDTTGTPTDALALPLAWNQRQQVWVPGPDYNPTQAGTFSKVCAGCHDTAPSLTTDPNGNVTSYTSGSPSIGCERCHGPGSAHLSAGGDAQLIINPAYLTARSSLEMCGQCHVNGNASTNPAGVFDFAWNNTATLGGGNFIPGVHKLSDFQTIPAYGDPTYYWPSGFPSIDHTPYMDMQGSVHGNNPYDKVTCTDCHDAHGLIGGPNQFARTDETTGDQFTFQLNNLALANDVICLACHASHGPFATVALQDVANYQLSTGGAVLKNGTAWTADAGAEATSASLVASNVGTHMLAEAGMYAFFDPTAVSGMPVGRCSSCHMAKTSWTAAFYPGLDANGKTANVIGDVSSHVFAVATPQGSLETVPGAATWDAVMPNACGSCHPAYRFGK